MQRSPTSIHVHVRTHTHTHPLQKPHSVIHTCLFMLHETQEGSGRQLHHPTRIPGASYVPCRRGCSGHWRNSSEAGTPPEDALLQGGGDAEGCKSGLRGGWQGGRLWGHSWKASKAWLELHQGRTGRRESGDRVCGRSPLMGGHRERQWGLGLREGFLT